MVEPISIGLSIAAGHAVSYVKGKTERAKFLSDSINNSVDRLADRHEGLDADKFLSVFEKDEVEDLVTEFDSGGEPVTPEELGEIVSDSDIGDVETPPEELVREFKNLLEEEVSKDPAIGHKLITNYSHRVHQLAQELDEGQEELLFGIQEIKAQVREPADEKGYEVFETVPEYYRDQLNGDHPTERYDFPFYGRKDEIKAFEGFVESDQNVFIVTGPTGIGKTRYVVEASLSLETSHPDWQVYTTDILAGNIDDGLSELDFEDEDNVILFVDNARDADQIERVFDLGDTHRSQVKLVFTERPYFVERLQDNAKRFSLPYETLQLQPIATDDIQHVVRDSYGIVSPIALDWISQVSEGRPQIAHLVAQAIDEETEFETDPIKESREIHEMVFSDAIAPIKDAAADRHFSEPRKAQNYIEYLAAIGKLNTDDDEFRMAFRDALSLDSRTEAQYQNLLTDVQGLVYERGAYLEIKPDVLREYIVYDAFFDGSARDFKAEIVDQFGQFTEEEQVHVLYAIYHRYNSTEAKEIVDGIIDDHLDRMDKYSIARRVNLLRDYKFLSSAAPLRGIELVDRALGAEVPETEDDEGLQRTVLKAPSPGGNLYLAAITILHGALLREPEAATTRLIGIASDFPRESSITEDALQKIRQELRPGLNASPVAQRTVVEVLGNKLQGSDLSNGMKHELLDILGTTSSTQISDFTLDPVEAQKLRTRTGRIPISEERRELRLAVIENLIDFITGEISGAIQRKAVEKLTSFVTSQSRYYASHDIIFNEEEVARIYDFAIEFVEQGGDLLCMKKLKTLVDLDDADEFGVAKKANRLQELMKANESFRLLEQMNPERRGLRLEERNDEIRSFIQEFDDIESEIDQFREIVSAAPENSFSPFFRILGEEHPNVAAELLEDPVPEFEEYLSDLVFGISIAQPEMGKKLINDYAEQEQYELLSSGLKALVSEDWNYVVDTVEATLEEESQYGPEKVSQLSQVVHLCWETNQGWAESIIVDLLSNAETLNPQIMDVVLRPISFHDDEEVRELDVDLLLLVLEYAENRPSLANEPREVPLAIAEVAARNPNRFVEFCIARCENGYTGTQLLPPHLDIDTDRMQESDDYEDALKQFSELILDVDKFDSMQFSDLSVCFSTVDVAKTLIPKIEDCSEDELIQIIHYFHLLPMSDGVSELLVEIMQTGVEDIRRAENVRNSILAALNSAPTAGGWRASAEGRKQEELEKLQEWQDDNSLPVSVRQFAKKAEQYLEADIEQANRFFDGEFGG